MDVEKRTAYMAPNLVRWGAVFAGTVISLAAFSLVSSLWLGIAYNDNDTSGWVSGNLPWWIAGTAIGALFLAGLLAGFLSGVRGIGAGLANGLTAWGLLFVASLLTVVPGLAAITTELGAGLGAGTNVIGDDIGQAGGGFTASSAVWTAFWSLLIGAVVAAIGGIVGGGMRREVTVADTDVRGERHDHDHDPYPTSVSVEETETRREPVREPVVENRNRNL